MQSILELVTAAKQAVYSRLTRSMPAKRCASTAISAGAAGASLQGIPANTNDMQIMIPRPQDLAPPFPPPNFNYNRELVPYPDDGYSDTKELLKEIGIRAAQNLVFLGITMYVAKKLLQWAVDAMDPTSKEKVDAQQRADKLLEQIGIQDVQLNELELALASNLVNPASIRVGFDDVGGLDEVINDLGESVILPLKNENLFKSSKLLQPPKGVLLYGPPGCGKTMIAKATAREAGARFLNINLSSLLDKWYGESQKRVEALFTLALKIQPTIIFIDEIDSILRGRNSSDHEATAMMKTQFMSLWDGLSTDTFACRVIIMGATNRPSDLDEAIMRRMPLKFYIGLPETPQRFSILKIILEGENVDGDVNLDTIAQVTDRFSGSDLKELCRNASSFRVREFVRSGAGDWRHMSTSRSASPSMAGEKFRPISNDDLRNSAEKMLKTKRGPVTADVNSYNSLD